MRLIATTLALGLLAATPGLAKERVSDAAYIAAARCQGVLGASADPSLKAFLKEQGRNRQDFVQDRATNAKNEGRRQAAQPAAADGVCAQYVARSPMSGASMAATR